MQRTQANVLNNVVPPVVIAEAPRARRLTEEKSPWARSSWRNAPAPKTLAGWGSRKD